MNPNKWTICWADNNGVRRCEQMDTEQQMQDFGQAVVLHNGIEYDEVEKRILTFPPNSNIIP